MNTRETRRHWALYWRVSPSHRWTLLQAVEGDLEDVQAHAQQLRSLLRSRRGQRQAETKVSRVIL
jgi:cell shape-determining protein MreC